MKKVYYFLNICNLLSCSALFLTNNVIIKLNNNDFIYNVFWFIVAWCPILVLIPVGIVYSLTAISKKYDDAMKFTIPHILLLFAFVIVQFTFPPFYSTIGIVYSNIFIFLLSVISFVLQNLAINSLHKKCFNIKYESKMSEKIIQWISEETKLKTLTSKFEKVNIIALVCCISSPSKYFFYISILVCVIISSFKLINLCKEYLKIKGFTNRMMILLFSNYYLCCFLSILIYTTSDFLSFVFLLANNCVIYFLNNKYARMIYKDVEKRMLADNQEVT